MKLSFQVHKPVAFIFDHLTDMQKFASVHPVIYQIDNIDDGNYIIHEQLKFGFIPFSFNYTARLEKNQVQKRVKYYANVMNLIEFYFSLKSVGNISVIEENIQIKTLLPTNLV